MATSNPITGDLIMTRGNASEAYAEGYDRIWGSKKNKEEPKTFHLKQYGTVSEAEMNEYIKTGKIGGN